MNSTLDSRPDLSQDEVRGLSRADEKDKPDAAAQPDTTQVEDFLADFSAAASARIVNRTHRVVRQRAQVIQARRSRSRSLTVPLAICSAMLLLTCAGLWIGLDQYQAAEIQDVALLAATEASRHFLIVLLWFVPVTMALLAAAWIHRGRGSGEFPR